MSYSISQTQKQVPATVIAMDGTRMDSLENKAPLFRVLVFIGNLASGGKERRLVEMLSYFKQKDQFEFLLVMSKDEVHYRDFYDLGIPHVVLKKLTKNYDVSAFVQLYQICKKFKPHIVHTWGRIQTFYSLPAIQLRKIPLLNSQITSAPPLLKKWSINGIIDRLNFFFSKLVLSNSVAGLNAYNPPAIKSRVIYNGINLKRFQNLPDAGYVRNKYGIDTDHVVLMAASFSSHKDYHRFYAVAKYVTSLRNDITFIGVGASAPGDTQYNILSAKANGNKRILFPGKINDVEALISVATIGVLFSNAALHGEGISNAVMEYMCMGLPVIANDAGGTREIVLNGINGYLVNDEPADVIGQMIISVTDDASIRKSFGNESRKLIEQHFLLSKMGQGFEEVYFELLEDQH